MGACGLARRASRRLFTQDKACAWDTRQRASAFMSARPEFGSAIAQTFVQLRQFVGGTRLEGRRFRFGYFSGWC